MAEVVSLTEAIAELIHDGDAVALEGFTHLIPMAAGHEIIRQGRRDLTLIRMTPDLIYDQMIGAGCARRLVFSWGGNPGVGSLHRFRDAVENQWPHALELEEHTHAGDGEPIRGRGLTTSFRGDPWIRRLRPHPSRSAERLHGHLSVHGRGPHGRGRAASRRHDRPRAARRPGQGNVQLWGTRGNPA